MNLCIKSWVGRLGNNMTQLLHVIFIALYYNYNIIIPRHKFFIEQYIVLNEKITIHDEIITDNDQFFRKHKIKNIDKNLFSDIDISNKAITLLRELFILKEMTPLNNNDVVIHIRGGDVFKESPNREYPSPPLSYYINILNKNNYDNIYLISDDTKNPTLYKLLELYPHIQFKRQSLENDLKLLLRSPNVIMCVGTFVPMLLTISTNIKNVYKTSYQSEPHGNHMNVHNIELHDYYKKMFPWKNTEEQRKLMMTY